MIGNPRLRLFLDSNVLTAGIVSSWGLDKAALSLCAARVCRLVLAAVVRDEVEENLLVHAQRLVPRAAEQLIEDYHRLIQLTAPQIVQYPDVELVRKSRDLVRHEADVPVILSALAAQPDWVLTHNVRHFTPRVAERTGLRIATPLGFFQTLSSALR